MVAGQVQPPRIDLANEDHIRSDVRANWPAETARELRSTTSDVLDRSLRSYPVRAHLADT
jgi:hypothetical protein